MSVQGNYFVASKEALRSIRVNEPPETNGLLQAVYLILCCNTNKEGFTYAGQNAISKILPNTGRRRADQYLSILMKIALPSGKFVVTEHESAKRKRNFKPYIGHGDDSFCIPNVFVNAKGQQGLIESHLSKICRLLRTLRGVSLSLMLELYAAYDPLSYWGCNPETSIRVYYEPYAENESQDIELETSYRDGALSINVYDNQNPAEYTNSDFIGYVTQERELFWQAYSELKKLGCIFTLDIVFSENSFMAEPLYLIYCHQRHLREKSEKEDYGRFSGMHSKTLSVLDELTDARMHFYMEEGRSPVWVAVSNANPDPCLIGIVRPLYVAQTEDELLTERMMNDSAKNAHFLLC